MFSRWARTRHRRRLAATAGAVLLSATASGCFWQQPGYGPEHARYNPSEDTLTSDNVASLAEAWQVEFPGAYVSEPLISGGRVYTTVRTTDPNPSTSVEALRLSSGAPLWTTPVAARSDGAPVTFSGGALWLTHGDPTASPCSAALTGLDPLDGHVLASDPVNVPATEVVTSGAVAAYVVAATCGGWQGPNTLVVRDPATQATRWTADIPGPVWVSPRISDGVIYVLGGTTLRAFAADGCGALTCAPLWSATLGDLQGDVENEQLLDLIVTGGRVFVASTATVDDPWHDVYVQGAKLSVYAADTGAFLWRHTYFGSYFGEMADAGISGIAVDDTSVFVASARGDYPDPSIIAIDAYPVEGCGSYTCQPTWSGQLPADSSSTSTLAVGGGVVYAAVKNRTPDGGGDGALMAFDAGGCGATTCTTLMSASFPGWPRTISLAQGTIVVQSDVIGTTGVLTAFRPTG